MADNKVFKEYYSESTKDYKFTLKLAVQDVDGYTLDCLEACLAKYELVSASAFKKTPIQESPLDFPNIKNSPVHICEIITTYPSTQEFLETYIATALGICKQSVVVYSENDPRGFETDLFLERSSPEFKENYDAALGEEGYPGDLTNEEAKSLYGDGHNLSFLKSLNDARQKQDVTYAESALMPEQTIEKPPEGYDDFNKNADKEDFGIFGRAPKKPGLIRGSK